MANEDPSLNVVLFEDCASIVGVLVAGAAIGLSHVLESPIPDALGSIVIGGETIRNSFEVATQVWRVSWGLQGLVASLVKLICAGRQFC